MRTLSHFFAGSTPKIFTVVFPVLIILALIPDFHTDTAFGSSIKELKKARFLSFTVRDQPLGVEEAKALYQGSTSIDAMLGEWLESSQHEDRIKRFFRDVIGIRSDLFLIPDSHLLKLDEDNGHYYLEGAGKGNCAANATVDLSAWWLQSGQTAKFCSNISAEGLSFNSNAVLCAHSGTNGIVDSRCGCGPNRLLCFPNEYLPQLRSSVREEFPERAWQVYLENKSWQELLASTTFYGNRFLYYYYLHQSQIFPLSASPNASELSVLQGLPIDSIASAPMPSSGATRAGIVTAPGFLKQFNNFRSRIDALTSALHCKDVDGSLNTDGIATFVNSNLDTADRAHGSNEGCASCHHPMDNMGAMLMGWSDQGTFQAWKSWDLSGHAFGTSISGPENLVHAFISETEAFQTCLSKRVWEDFSGSTWDTLTSTQQAEIKQEVAKSPKEGIQSVLLGETLASLRDEGLSQQTVDNSEEISFEEVNLILKLSCSGSGCHSNQSSLGSKYAFVDNPSVFKETNVARLQDGSMPPSGSDFSITNQDMQILIDFINQ